MKYQKGPPFIIQHSSSNSNN